MLNGIKKQVVKINNSKFCKSWRCWSSSWNERSFTHTCSFACKAWRIKNKQEIGGCALGIREIDPHLEVFKALGQK